MMKLDSSKMMLLIGLGIGAYFLTMKRATAGQGSGMARPAVQPRYSASPNAYTPPNSSQANAAGWGETLGGLTRLFSGMNANTAQQPGYTVGPSYNSRAARDAADANDIFMPGYSTGETANSRSSRDAYDNTDSYAINPAGQYDMDIRNNGWGEG